MFTLSRDDAARDSHDDDPEPILQCPGCALFVEYVVPETPPAGAWQATRVLAMRLAASPSIARTPQGVMGEARFPPIGPRGHGRDALPPGARRFGEYRESVDPPGEACPHWEPTIVLRVVTRLRSRSRAALETHRIEIP